MIKELAVFNEDKLAQTILRYRKLYNEGRPEISDDDFDKLEQKLKELNPKNPALDRMKSPIDKSNYKLPWPLPSLHKIRPDTGADKWLASHPGPYVVTDKLDGLSAEISYTPGLPTKAYSSGDDGISGKDISHLLPYLGVPTALKKRMVVRVELIMTRADFQKFWSTKYKNPRNLAVGIKNTTTGIHPASKHYKAVALSVLEPRIKPSVAFAQLKTMGFLVVPNKTYESLTVSQLERLFAIRRKSSAYDVDGVVIEQDKITKAPRDYPEHQVAFKDKLGIENAQIEVKRVTWETSRFGKLTPRIWIDPIRLNGVDIEKASGHNARFVYENRIGPGAVITLIRSGDVIPKIESVVTPARSWSPPPGREGKDWDWTDSGADVFAHKKLEASDQQRIRAMTHFFVTMGVDGIREGTVRNLYEAGFDTVEKMLEAHAEEYADILGSKVAQKIADSIDEHCFNVYPATLAYAWGGFDRGVGSKTLWAVYKELGNAGVKALLKKSEMDIVRVLMPIPGVGQVAATAIAKKLKDFYKFVDSLEVVDLVQYVPEKVKLKSKKLSGQVVLFTGFRDADLTNDIQENGGEVVDSMNANVTMLLVKDLGSTSTKTQAAKKRGIPIMTAMGFRSKYKV